MIEPIVTAGLGVIGLYLTVGVCVAAGMHLRGLAAIDSATRSTRILFRILITPGLITFWPLGLSKWRQARAGKDTAGSLDRPLGQYGLQQWHGKASIALLVFCPCAILIALLSRTSAYTAQGAPSEVLDSSQHYIVEVLMGQRFSSIPAEVLLARSPDSYGLVFRFPTEVSIPPMALYWSENPDTPNELVPPDATFLGMVWADSELWVDLPDRKMRYSGYWLAYSFLDESTEYVPCYGTSVRSSR